jgi:hypothetical protein
VFRCAVLLYLTIALVFRYDINGDSYIDQQEMLVIVSAIYKMVGSLVALQPDEVPHTLGDGFSSFSPAGSIAVSMLLDATPKRLPYCIPPHVATGPILTAPPSLP